ncbi:restriction endonuclease subunit S [Providencia stuartii]|uniref:restriction endonuclease subunit S n=1 Tax=Providencia stuartii TaxID=588 RepID=UPI0013A7609F|nr:restriction endonuclease subunit S [Providencia stuartii]QIB29191.1 restriction endonuclease subunit S [Providencia stuartii]
MSEWRECLLNDIAIVTMGQSPSGDSCNINGIGVPLLNGPTEFGIKYPIEAQYTIQPRKHSEPKDILFCVRGSTTGRMNWSDKKYAIGRGLASIRHKSGYEYNHYLKGILDFHLNELLSAATGSTFPNISREQLNKLEITCPPLPEQKAIASVLSSLDNKIDLLHRQNKTLESMAETLFRQWFVEEVQDDWDVYSLEEVSTISIGRTPPRKNKHLFSSDINDVKWLSIKDMGKSGIYRMYTEEYLPKSTIESFKIPIIPTNTVVLSFKMTVGRVGITHEEMVSNEAIAQFNIKKIISTEFLYCFLKQYNYDSLGTTSSIVTSINTGLIKSIQFSIPNDTKVAEFTQRTKPFFEKVKKNQMEIQTLEKLRDTLLPKLMSGEVRVSYTPEEIKQ